MPASDQAMGLVTDKGKDTRIRIHIPTSVSNLPHISRGYQDRFERTRANIKSSTGFLDVIDVRECRVDSRYPRQDTLPNFRRRNIPGRLVPLDFDAQKAKERISQISTIPKDAKYMPVPPGTKHRKLIAATQGSADDVSPPIISCKRIKEQPKSLIDELKELTSYDSRLLPAMQMRKELPPSSPNTVVFSLRNNDVYSHNDIKVLIERQTGLKARSIQYDPINVRIGSSEISSRWIIKLGSSAETYTIVQSGLEVNGEKIIVRRLDDIHTMEVSAYRLKMQEQRKLADKEGTIRIPKKRRTRGTTKQSVKV